MPRNPLAAVGSVRNFIDIVKEVNFDDIRERAMQAPRILVISRSQEVAARASADVFGDDSDQFVEIRSGERIERFDSSRYDVVVVTDPDRSGLFEQVRKQARNGKSDAIFFLASDGEAPVERLRDEIVMSDPDLAPALGRWFPGFRAAAVHAIIDSTSKANAKFALVSNVPSIVPILGSFVSAGADFIVLTKNQVMMAYKLAAVNGRELDDQGGIIRELAPVVGAGFVWRTVAREATSFLPMMAGTIPKVGIAFAGTYSTGMAVDYYYRFGRKPGKEQMKAFSELALRLAASIPLPGRKEEAEQQAIEAELEHPRTENSDRQDAA